MNGRLWAFSGLDGAGKSTQIELLQRKLTEHGWRNRRVWARGGYTPVFDLAKAAVRRLQPTVLPAPGRSTERTERFSSPFVRRIWLALAMVDLGFYYGVWVRGLRILGWAVVADRWVEDTELDFHLNFPEEKCSTWLLWRVVRWISPQPETHVVFTIPVEESLRRSSEKSEPFPDSASILELRLHYYEGFARSGRVHRMDGRRSREDLHEEILRICGLNR